jgi:hypothetical protein
MQWSANRVEKSGNRSFWHGANWGDCTKQNDKELPMYILRAVVFLAFLAQLVFALDNEGKNRGIQ